MLSDILFLALMGTIIYYGDPERYADLGIKSRIARGIIKVLFFLTAVYAVIDSRMMGK